MIEWTICKVCKSVVDNSNETCPNCGGEVEKHEIIPKYKREIGRRSGKERNYTQVQKKNWA